LILAFHRKAGVKFIAILNCLNTIIKHPGRSIHRDLFFQFSCNRIPSEKILCTQILSGIGLRLDASFALEFNMCKGRTSKTNRYCCLTKAGAPFKRSRHSRL